MGYAGVIPRQDPGTLRMVETLQRIYQEALENPRPYFFLNKARADMLRQAVHSVPRDQQHELRLVYARELLHAGETPLAIQELEQMTAGLADDLTWKTKPVADLLALAYLRLGEQQNCLDHPAAEACILPLRGEGLHSVQEGSRRAVAHYRTLLDQFPDDYQSRWLLNVAYMTLGDYPKRVPDAWRIDGLEAHAQPALPRFSNVAVDLGVDVLGLSGGLSVEDFDNDGFLDLFMTSYGLDNPVRFFLNDGRGGFVDHTEAAGLHGIVGGLNVIHADYNNDGFADVFILRGAWLGTHGAHPNSLLKNNGDGTFSDATFASGLLSYHPTQTAAWRDFNNDGFLDLFIGNETRRSSQLEIVFYGGEDGTPHPCELYVNNGDGTFTEVAAAVGLKVTAFVKSVVWGDINNDGLADLYVSVEGDRNHLYVNRGGASLDDWRFEEIEAGVGEPLMSFPAWFWDYNNDGWDDLLVLPYDLRQIDAAGANVAREYLGLSTLTEKPRLYRNNGDETFSNVTGDAGLSQAVLYAMGSNYGDLNNDGFPDAYVGTGSPDLRALVPNRMFLNEGGVRFKDVTFDGGFGHLQKGHGVAFVDFDRDGDQDIYAVMGGAVEGDVAANVLFDNPGVAPDNAWVILLLEGETANRSAIGARIRVTVTNRDGNRQTFYRTVSTGGSFGASSLQQAMGLGEAVQIDTLQIAWPNRQRTVETHTGVPIRRYVRIAEGQPPEVLNRPPVPWRTPEPHRHQ